MMTHTLHQQNKSLLKIMHNISEDHEKRETWNPEMRAAIE